MCKVRSVRPFPELHVYISSIRKRGWICFVRGTGCAKPPCTLNKMFETKAREIAESSGGYDHNDRVPTLPLESTGMHGYARTHPSYHVFFCQGPDVRLSGNFV